MVRVSRCQSQVLVMACVALLTHCGSTALTHTEAIPFDPCYNYTVLDDSWRSTSNHHSSSILCDVYVSWVGWYRLFIGGQSAQMPDTCVDKYSCSTHAPLWLNGQHPQVEDGVVTRNICGHWGNDCCYFQSNPIKVKACPGNYYVYEFVQPNFCYGTYCAAPTPSSEPCSGYNVLDDNWRDLRTNFYQSYYNDDRYVEWNGWYRLYLNGQSAQLSEWCASFTGCGGEVGLYLNGSHPKPEDGVVTREVLGSSSWAWWWWWWNTRQCGYYKSTSIEIKACPGDYYVYKLIKPDMSIPTPTYCAGAVLTLISLTTFFSPISVAFNNISNDPCYNYETLDRPWRATNETGLYICDENFSWNGWYRLFYNGMDIRMQESCVNAGSCNAYSGLWLNGPHPQIEDGVVTIEICGGTHYGCCDFKSTPIRVKACPGDYYVYELVKPHSFWCSGYCTAAINTDFDPCNDYNILDNSWRSTLNFWYQYAHDDTLVEWHDWYRLFINGLSAQMPEWCFSYMSCGGFISLWLGGPHPQPEDGVVTREVYGSVNDQCSYYRSDPIQVKACPGNYYVYKIKRPKVLIPAPAYCAGTDFCLFLKKSYLDEPRRATIIPQYDKYYYYEICDYNVNWNGWYRLFYNGQSVQMPESSVSYGMCGTSYPLWLNGPHPQLEDGVVTRQVCGSTWNDCCGYKSHPIRVKACPGNYYVYEFVRPTFCSAYCAGRALLKLIGTILPETGLVKKRTIIFAHYRDIRVELSCTENERCAEKHGVYGCSCMENHHRSQNDSFDFIETCESSSGSMSLSRCQLFEAGFPSDILHLNDPNCRGTVQNGRVEFYFDNNDHICGTNLVANGTHFIYQNFIVGEPDLVGHLISRKKILKLSFSCVYLQTQTLSMDINPLESTVHINLPAGQGTYRVRMIPYQDAEFSHPFAGSVNAELSKRIFVEVGVDGVDSRQFASVIDTCWATPVNDPHYPLRWDLIVDRCPNPNDDTVELLQNGVSTSSRFSFEMFIFTADSTKVYLHCAIHLCLLTDNHCSVHCDSEQHHREGRSVDFHDSNSISLGPLMWSDSNKDTPMPRQVLVSRAPCLLGSLTISLISLMSLLIFF
uniref:Si:ch73-181m17.1 n=1 Tax=Cyprinus carpio TaxID=7962 RepID=A0A8C1X4M7_CYPCA